MFQTMADFTPLAISLVGLGQVGIVGWGIHVMRNASEKRSEQTDLILESLRETLLSLHELREASQESSKGIRELLKKGSDDGEANQ